MFNNHICSYERKYCCSIKPLNSANKCFAPILTWKKFGPLGWVIYKVIEERRATITISDRQMQDYLKRHDLYLFFWINCYWNLALSWNWTEAKDFLRIKKYWVTTLWSQGGILYADGQRLALSERMMEIGHSELGLETKRKSKIPVRVYLIAFLDFFQSENLRFENCIELLHFDCLTLIH